MDLATFHADIKTVLRRGSSQDAAIPGWTRRAARWLEENYTLSHMMAFGEISLDPDAEVPEQVDLPEGDIKKIEYVRMVIDGETPSYFYLPQVAPADVSSIDLGNPSGYWINGPYLWLDSRIQEPLTLELQYAQYTDWPTDTSALPELLKRYELALRNKVLLDAAVDLKDSRMVEVYQARLAETLSTSLRAQVEGEQANIRFVMRPRFAD